MAVRITNWIILTTALMIGVSAQVSLAQDIPALQRQLTSRKTEDRRNALHALRAIGTADASRAAVPALRDKSEIVRATAAMAVVMLPGGETAELLAPLLDDKSEFVRKEAATAIGLTRTPRTVDLIAQRLNKEKNHEVRAALVIGLGSNAELSGITTLLEVLSLDPKEDEEFVRRSAARSIGQIVQMKRMGFVDATTPRDFLKEIPKASLPSAEIGDEARSLLLRVFRDTRESEDTKREVVYAMGVIGDPVFRDAIEPLVRSEDVYMARIAAEALARLTKGDD